MPALSSVLALIMIAAPLVSAQDSQPQDAMRAAWPGWRGPNGDGTSSTTALPTEWSPASHIAWRAPMPSWSGATPVIWGDTVFIMSPSTPDPEDVATAAEAAVNKPRRRGSGRHPGGQVLMLLALDAGTGDLRWQRELDAGNRLWLKSNETSPSPVTDGQTVWATTGTGMLSAFNFAGKFLWDLNIQAEHGAFGHNWGYASSPLLHDGKLILEVLHGTKTEEPSFLLALDAASGDLLWKVDRATDAQRESPDAYTTPLLLQRGETTQFVITGGDYVTGHDPKTGQELWRVAGLNPRRAPNYRIVSSPILIDDLLIAPTRVRPMLAIALGDNLTPTDDDIAWTWDGAGGPDVPSPTTDGRFLYLVDDKGMATCIDPALGEAVWGPERTVQGTLSGSPVYADGKVYFTNEEGVTVVLRAGPTFEILATNDLDGSYTLSSPAIANDRLFIRTEQFLYCIAAD